MYGYKHSEAYAQSRFHYTTLRLHALAVGIDIQDSQVLIYSAMEKNIFLRWHKKRAYNRKCMCLCCDYNYV